MAICKRPAADHPRTACRKRMRIGTTADYEQICCLGEGGYGFVVKGRHRGTGHTVAIKFHHDRSGGDERPNLQGLLREARFLEACGGHTHLVRFGGIVSDCFTGDLALVMEYVDGQSLRNFHRERCTNPPPPETTVRSFMWKLLEGARMMHERGIIHRDIKPDNILVAEGGHVVKICDLGLAMSTSDAPPYGLAGTAMYKAPEMVLGKPDYDARVDTWSLGCVMVDLITGGERLFDEKEPISLLQRIFKVLGTPDDETWPGFTSLPLADAVPAAEGQQQHNTLRELFPEDMLSSEGFEVLSGLLTCNPDKRLTAAAALKLPWFAGFPPAAASTKVVPVKQEAAAIAPPTRHRKRVRAKRSKPQLSS